MNSGFDSDIEQFLRDYPGMSLAPSRSTALTLKGKFSFQAKSKQGPEIFDSFDLIIKVPSTFPHTLPDVIEFGNKIPRDRKHHVNPDGTLCLGSPLRLLLFISVKPTLVGFAEECIVPFLYAVSNKLQNGGDFIFSELDHGTLGIINDYLELFQLQRPEQVVQTLNLLGLKRRIANKKQCPCECGLRLGKCSFNKKVNKYRSLASRSWFKKHAYDLMGQVQ